MAAFPVGQVGAGQVGGAAEEFRQHLDQGVDRDLRSLASGDGLALGVDRGNAVGHVLLPVVRQLAGHAALEFGGFGRVFLGVFGELVAPQLFQSLALHLGIPAVIDFLRDFERGVFPAQVLARCFHFVMAQRRAVHVVGAFLVGRAFADDGLAADQGGPGGFRLGLRRRPFPARRSHGRPHAE